MGPTPTAESIFGVKSAVDVLRVKFKVSRNCGRHKLASRRHTHAKLKWLGFQEKAFVSLVKVERAMLPRRRRRTWLMTMGRRVPLAGQVYLSRANKNTVLYDRA